jgi:hypothetical protein
MLYKLQLSQKLIVVILCSIFIQSALCALVEFEQAIPDKPVNLKALFH